MARVVWSERALADLEELLGYLENQSPSLACRYASAIVDRVDQLQSHPLSGGRIAEPSSREYRQLIQGAYRIVYRVDGDRVLVVATHHAARLLDADALE